MMKRKLISAFLTFAMLLAIAPLGAITAYAANVGDTFTANNSDGVEIKYKVTDAVNLTAEVEPNSYSAATVKIPDTVSDGTNTYTVTSIGDFAFYACKDLTSVTIPVGVTSIGDSAFYGCTALTSVTIPVGVTSLESFVFGCCIKLTAIYVDAGNSSFASVDGVLFDQSQSTLLAYPNAKGSAYTIPAGVTSIGEGAFHDCTGLTSVRIPDTVTSIGNQAFVGCEGLTSVTIPRSVTSIGGNVFDGCANLRDIQVDAGNSCFASVDGVLFNHNQSTLLAYPNAKGSAYTIPVGVTSIGNNAFVGCTGLTSVIIPVGVTSIGSFAFSNCTSLTNVTIPVGVTSIGSAAFSNCTSLTNVAIPVGVTSIGSAAFSSCAGLTSVTIPAGVTLIGDFAFYGSTSLTSVTIPAGVTAIGSYAFNYCSELESVYFDGEQPSTIGTQAFQTTTATTLYYNASVASFPATIDSQNCVGRTAYAVAVDGGIANGTVTPSTANGIPGETVTLNIVPANGYALKALTYTDSASNTISIPITANYCFTMPNAAVTISAAFGKICTITFDQNGGDTAASPTSATVIDGDPFALPTTNPTRSGYTFAGWNTAANGSGTAFTAATPVTDDITVYAQWTANSTGGDDDNFRYTITASAGVGGSISPNGSASVADGCSKTFTVTPSDGYAIKDVLVDGVSVGAVNSYTFKNLKKAHSISAAFAKKEPVQPFTDVKGSDWFYDSVTYVRQHGMMAGTDSDRFSPRAAMTRQMLWTVLARMDGKAPASMVEAKAWAVENKISDGSNPADPITREQLAAILYRYAQFKGYDTTQGGMAVREFTDYDSISDYALPALGWAVSAGLVQGSNNQIMPSGTATRAQVATILMRFNQKLAK